MYEQYSHAVLCTDLKTKGCLKKSSEIQTGEVNIIKISFFNITMKI